MHATAEIIPSTTPARKILTVLASQNFDFRIYRLISGHADAMPPVLIFITIPQRNIAVRRRAIFPAMVMGTILSAADASPLIS